MNRIDNATLAHNMKWGMILLGGFIASLVLGTTLATNSRQGVIAFFAIVLPLVWIMAGSRYWWLPLPFGMIIGGVFQFGFKIFPHELGLAIGVASLATALPLKWSQLYQNRRPIPRSILVLCLYLLLHLAGSLLYNKYAGMGGAGNVLRSYTSMLWPIIFLIVFHMFGNSKQIHIALKMMLCLAIFRVCLGYFANLTELYFYIPVINYIPSPFTGVMESGNVDFRASGTMLASFAMIASLLSARRIWKYFWFAIFIVGFVTLLSGGGRGAAASFCVFPMLLIVLYRKWLTFAFVCAMIVVFIGCVNLFPQTLDIFPYSVGRALTVFVIGQGSELHLGDTESSNAFHDAIVIEGIARWTANWNTLVFGTGIRPFNPELYDMASWDPTMHSQEMLKNAANTGSYEAGLWNVLVVTGTVGLCLYLNAFRFLLFRLAKSIWNKKICDAGHAFAFLGVFQIIVWLLLAWRTSSWPSEAIFYAYLGYVWIQDQEEWTKNEARESARGQRSQKLPDSGPGPQTAPGRGPDYGNPAYS